MKPVTGAIVMRARTGAATLLARMVPAENPAKRAASATMTEKAGRFRRRSAPASEHRPKAPSGAHRLGLSAPKNSRMPRPKQTAIQGKSRRCSTSRANAPTSQSRPPASCQWNEAGQDHGSATARAAARGFRRGFPLLLSGMGFGRLFSRQGKRGGWERKLCCRGRCERIPFLAGWRPRPLRSRGPPPCSSCPDLIRAPTPWERQRHEDVDGRVKPGHDAQGGNLTRATFPSGTVGSLPTASRVFPTCAS